MLPEDEQVFGSLHRQMVVMYGTVVPSPGVLTPAYHVFPLEFLTDPAYPKPGMPLRWLPPPPVFYRGFAVEGFLGSHYTRVFFDVSIKEDEEEGGGTLFTFTVRGDSYIMMIGL